jgi:Family of unknown function (DUF6496)
MKAASYENKKDADGNASQADIGEFHRQGARSIWRDSRGDDGLKTIAYLFSSLSLLAERGENMPEKETIERAREDEREGKSPSTQAGEFIREEMQHIREGKHGARSPEQAIAIGLSKARRAGVKLPPPKKGRASAKTRAKAERELKEGRKSAKHRASKRRSNATKRALRREGGAAASERALSTHARTAAKRRSPRERHESARKAVHTKGSEVLQEEARKAAETRAKNAC